MKLVINKCYGGFSISAKAMAEIAKRKGLTLHWFGSTLSEKAEERYIPMTEEQAFEGRGARFEKGGPLMVTAVLGPNPEEDEWFSNRPDERHDPDLVAVVEEMGEAAYGDHAELAVIEIPDGVDYSIEEYDGREWVAERHRTWA